MEQKRKLNIPKHLRDRIEDAARNDGITVEEKLAQLLDYEQGIEPEDEPEETTAEKEEAWRTDMQQLLVEHDREIWLWSVITKLINHGQRQVSQFNYLRQIRCQT